MAEMGPILGLINFDAKMYGNFEGLFFHSVLFGLVSYSDRCVFLFWWQEGVAFSLVIGIDLGRLTLRPAGYSKPCSC